MLRLQVQPNLNNFLSATVKPESLADVTKCLCQKASLNYEFNYRIFKSDSKFDYAIDLNLSRDDFIILDPLENFKWYSPDEFDGNPEGKLLLEESVDKTHLTSKHNWLMNKTVRFMYITEN